MVPIVDRPEDPLGGAEGPADPGDPGERRSPPTETEVHAQLARDILRIHEESYGKGAGKAHALVSGDWVIVVLEDLELLPNEKFLVDNGKGDAVTQVRTQFQLSVRSTFTAAVERATGRAVSGFVSASSVTEPTFAAEIFKLR